MLRVLLHGSCGPVLLQLIRLLGDSLKERELIGVRLVNLAVNMTNWYLPKSPL